MNSLPKISYASWDSCKSYPLKGVCTLDSYAFFYVLFCSLLLVLFIFQFYFLRYFYLFKVTPKLYIPSTLNIDLLFPNIPQKVKTRFIFIQFLFHFSSKATAVAWSVAGSWLSLDFQLPLDIKSYFSIFLFFLHIQLHFQPFSGFHIYFLIYHYWREVRWS